MHRVLPSSRCDTGEIQKRSVLIRIYGDLRRRSAPFSLRGERERDRGRSDRRLSRESLRLRRVLSASADTLPCQRLRLENDQHSKDRARTSSPCTPLSPPPDPPSPSPSRVSRSFARSFSLFRFHMSFRQHLSHSTTFTSADLVSPPSAYANGSSSVLSDGRGSVGSMLRSECSAQRVFPHVLSPAPATTSSSVRQRSANCHAKHASAGGMRRGRTG